MDQRRYDRDKDLNAVMSSICVFCNARCHRDYVARHRDLYQSLTQQCSPTKTKQAPLQTREALPTTHCKSLFFSDDLKNNFVWFLFLLLIMFSWKLVYLRFWYFYNILSWKWIKNKVKAVWLKTNESWKTIISCAAISQLGTFNHILTHKTLGRECASGSYALSNESHIPASSIQRENTIPSELGGLGKCG